MHKKIISLSAFHFIIIFCQSISPQICCAIFFFDFFLQTQAWFSGLILTSESVRVCLHPVCGRTVPPESFGIEPTAVLPGLDALPAPLPGPSPALPQPTHQ